MTELNCYTTTTTGKIMPSRFGGFITFQMYFYKNNNNANHIAPIIQLLFFVLGIWQKTVLISYKVGNP